MDEFTASETTQRMVWQLLEDRKVGEYKIPSEPRILHSGHIDLTAQALAQTPDQLFILGGKPGIAKTYRFDTYKATHPYYSFPDDLDPGPFYFDNSPVAGDRKVNWAKKIKDRVRNKAARKARRQHR